MEALTAVLTGDLIGSTEAIPDRLERSMAALAHHASLIGPDTRFTRFRGDGWQIYLPRPQDFLWVAVYLNAVLRSDPRGCLPSRIAIGLGRTDRLGPAGLSGASGTAFIHSGRALDAMVRVGQNIALAGEATDDIQRGIIAFIDDRITGWSQEQANVAMLRLTPQTDPTQTEIAAILGITRQAVSARFRAAGLSLILNACYAFRDHFQRPEDRHE